MRLLTNFLVFALIWLLTSSSFAQSYANAVVKVRAGGRGGSGALIREDGCILTAAHVISSSSTATATWRNGYQSSGKVIAIDRTSDIAIFKVTPPPRPIIIPLAKQNAKIGNECEFFGYTTGSLTKGRSSLRSYFRRGNAYYLRFGPLVRPGDSGGPIVLDGKVVGVISAYESAYRNGPPISSTGPALNGIVTLAQRCPPGLPPIFSPGPRSPPSGGREPIVDPPIISHPPQTQPPTQPPPSCPPDGCKPKCDCDPDEIAKDIIDKLKKDKEFLDSIKGDDADCDELKASMLELIAKIEALKEQTDKNTEAIEENKQAISDIDITINYEEIRVIIQEEIQKALEDLQPEDPVDPVDPVENPDEDPSGEVNDGERIIYFTEIDRIDFTASDQAALRLQKAGYPIKIVTLKPKPKSTSVIDVPRIHVWGTGRNIIGVSNCVTYMSSLTL
jgi:hypothetical protein